MKHKDKGKVIGIIGLVVSSIVTTLVTTWMSDKEIERQVNEALANDSNEEA